MGKIITDKDHLKKFRCIINKKVCEAVVWYEYQRYYLIQNIIEGKKPDQYSRGWKKHGKYSLEFFPKDLTLHGNNIIFFSGINKYELWEK